MSVNPQDTHLDSSAWPELPYQAFAPTAHLLHMSLQVIGKLKLTAPFQPHWDHVPLLITANGLTTGPIPFEQGEFSIDLDFIHHEIFCKTSWGQQHGFALTSRSVAEFTALLFDSLASVGIQLKINTKPQEVPNPIPFEQDTQSRPYDVDLVQAWWRILLSSRQVMERHHANFLGRTPDIGLMWGTFDLRDVRYNGKTIAVGPKEMDFIGRNAMDAEMIEIGWWPGDVSYPQPAYFSFTYPQPAGIEQMKIHPEKAQWHTEKREFILNYEDLRKSKHPEKDLLTFFESTYQAGAEKANWDPQLISHGIVA